MQRHSPSCWGSRINARLFGYHGGLTDYRSREPSGTHIVFSHIFFTDPDGGCDKLAAQREV